MTKSSIWCTLYFRSHISYDLHLWYIFTYKRIISPGVFSIFFFKILIFEIIRRGGGVKGQKMVQNNKKFCLYHSLSQKPCIIWLWFLVRVQNDGIASNFFHFLKFWFLGFWGGVKGKEWLTITDFSISCLYHKNCSLYHKNCSLYYRGFNNDIYRCFSFVFFFF